MDLGGVREKWRMGVIKICCVYYEIIEKTKILRKDSVTDLNILRLGMMAYAFNSALGR